MLLALALNKAKAKALKVKAKAFKAKSSDKFLFHVCTISLAVNIDNFVKPNSYKSPALSAGKMTVYNCCTGVRTTHHRITHHGQLTMDDPPPDNSPPDNSP